MHGGNLLSNSTLDWSFFFGEKGKPTQYSQLHINTGKHHKSQRHEAGDTAQGITLHSYSMQECHLTGPGQELSSLWSNAWRQDAQLPQAPCVPLKDSFYIWEVSFITVVQLHTHVWLCDPMDCTTPGFPALHHLPELAQTHVHRVGDAIQSSHPLSSRSLLAFSLLQHWVFSNESVLASGSQINGASASVLPVNIQGWFTLGLTGLISLQCHY